MNWDKQQRNGLNFAQGSRASFLHKRIEACLKDWITHTEKWESAQPIQTILAKSMDEAIIASVENALVQTMRTCGAGPWLPAGSFFLNELELSEGVGAVVIVENEQQEAEYIFGKLSYESPESCPDGAGAGIFRVNGQEVKALFAARLHEVSLRFEKGKKDASTETRDEGEGIRGATGERGTADGGGDLRDDKGRGDHG